MTRDPLVDCDLLEVEQHGPGVGAPPPGAGVRQGGAVRAAAPRPGPEQLRAAELVEADGDTRHVAQPPARPVPGGAGVVPAAVLDTRAAGHILDRLLDGVQVVVGVVVPRMQHQ